MKKLVIVFALVLSACGPSADQLAETEAARPTATPDISPLLRQQFTRIVEEGTKLNSMTEQGVNYGDFNDQLAEVRGAYDLAVAEWPAGFAPKAKLDLAQAFKGWELTSDLWALKIGKKDNPVEPDINGYTRYVDYGGEALVIEIHPKDYLVEQYSEKKFLPFDDNLGVLLALASKYFETGRTLLLEKLPDD